MQVIRNTIKPWKMLRVLELWKDNFVIGLFLKINNDIIFNRSITNDDSHFSTKEFDFTVECLEQFSCKKIVVLVDVEFKIYNPLVEVRRN